MPSSWNDGVVTDGPLRLLAVHAQPEEEGSKGAATVAKLVAEGAEVLIVTCTGGERGSILNPAMDLPEVVAELPEVRRREMAFAIEILGARHEWLGFVDSGFPEGDPLPPLPEGCFGLQPLETAVAPLVKIIREFRPHVMTTYDENGGYPHPDHVMCHKVSVEAFDAAGDPDRYPELGAPWQTLKLYYHMAIHLQRFQTLHEAMVAVGIESPYEQRLKDWKDRADVGSRVTTRVECAEYFSIRDRALIAHATQVDPTGFWFACPLEIQQRVWPTEDYELARSLVDSTAPEDDLFAGIRDRVTQ